METRRVVLCDDHEIVREALRSLIEAEGDLEIVGEAGDGDAVLAVVDRLKPDLLLLDIEMPGRDGIEVMVRALRTDPDLRVILLSAHEGPELMDLARASGAAGFLTKTEAAREILPAAHAVLDGKIWFPLLEVSGRPGSAGGDELRRLLTLTPRERAILELFARGLRAKGVAEQIGVRPATVYTHVRNAIHKLGVDSRTQAVAVAVKYSFLSLGRSEDTG